MGLAVFVEMPDEARGFGAILAKVSAMGQGSFASLFFRINLILFGSGLGSLWRSIMSVWGAVVGLFVIPSVILGIVRVGRAIVLLEFWIRERGSK